MTKRKWESALLRSLTFLASTALMCAVSLMFAFGLYSWNAFIGYFRNPLIFIFNWLPIILVQMLLLSACGRQWLAFLINSIITFLPAIGNFYKLTFRNDPFVFSDISSIRAGLAVAGDYDLQINHRIIVSVLFVAFGTLILFILIRKKTNKRARSLLLLGVLISIFPLWKCIYSNDELYIKTANQNFVLITRDDRDTFRAAGFPYPFLHSIKDAAGLAPDGYNAQVTKEKLGNFTSEPVADDVKPNIMVIQLESFSDYEAMGIEGISEFVYAPLRQLQEESYSGLLVPNVIGGGTVNTERCVLSGSFKLQQYKHPAYSFVRFFSSQGYYTTGSHPNVASFYSRGVVNKYLGFDEYLFRDNFFYNINEWRCDDTYLPIIFSLFREHAEKGENVFSFNVTTQGHWPYSFSEYYDQDDYWTGEKVKSSSRVLLNNYFSLITETQQILVQELDALRNCPEPMIVVIYGDHKPWLAEDPGLELGNSGFYEDLNLTFDLNTEEGLLQYTSTPYLIWANTAAKELTGSDFVGDAPTISPCYLMNVLFREIGWNGPAYMQYTNTIMDKIPVIYTNGCYVENGIYTKELSPEGKELLNEYDCLQYYVHYRPVPEE